MYSVISEDQNSSAGKKSEWKSDLVKKKKWTSSKYRDFAYVSGDIVINVLFHNIRTSNIKEKKLGLTKMGDMFRKEVKMICTSLVLIT